jgi:hypothetical protein
MESTEELLYKIKVAMQEAQYHLSGIVKNFSTEGDVAGQVLEAIRIKKGMDKAIVLLLEHKFQEALNTLIDLFPESKGTLTMIRVRIAFRWVDLLYYVNNETNKIRFADVKISEKDKETLSNDDIETINTIGRKMVNDYARHFRKEQNMVSILRPRK